MNTFRRWVDGKLGKMGTAACAAGVTVSAALGQVVQQPGTLGKGSAQPAPGQPEVQRPAPPAPQVVKPVVADTEAPSYPVSKLNVVFVTKSPQVPSVEQVFQGTVTLDQVGIGPGGWDRGYVGRGSGGLPQTLTLGQIGADTANPDGTPAKFSSRALEEIAEAIVIRINQLGVTGVRILADEKEFGDAEEGGPRWGKDLRKPGNEALTLFVLVGRVTEVRTLAFGDRIPDSKRVDAPEHVMILENSPVQPFQEGEDPAKAKDIIRKDLLDEYVFRLNRHPGRRVDTAVSQGKGENDITLDYLVNENKPWLLYAQVSNTGTKQTNEWRERFGFTHNQLTGDDDVLSLDYVTAGFEAAHAVTGSYERPIAGDWLRANVFGSWNKYTASDVGQANEQFKGTGYAAGGRLRANVLQVRELFVDLVGGVRFEHVKVKNEVTGDQGSQDFFLPNFGARLDRVTDRTATSAGVSFEFNMPGVAGTDRDVLPKLGRLDADSSWLVFQWDATHSFYLDPILFGSSWNDVGPGGHPTLAHEIALSFRGQYAFDYRLIPNEEQVVGGLYTVRGYPESVLAGDTVLVGSAEYRLHLPEAFGYNPEAGTLFGEPFRFVPQQPYGRADWDVVLKAFVDVGRAENSNRKSYENNATILGTGVGVDFLFKRNFSVRVDWGVALSDIQDQVTEGSNRFHIVATILY